MYVRGGLVHRAYHAIQFSLLTELQMMVTFHHHTACNKRINRTIVITVAVQGETVRSPRGHTVYLTAKHARIRWLWVPFHSLKNGNAELPTITRSLVHLLPKSLERFNSKYVFRIARVRIIRIELNSSDPLRGSRMTKFQWIFCKRWSGKRNA